MYTVSIFAHPFPALYCSYLISKGADPNAADNKGVTPLDLAAKASNGVRTVLGLPPHEESSSFVSSELQTFRYQ